VVNRRAGETAAYLDEQVLEIRLLSITGRAPVAERTRVQNRLRCNPLALRPEFEQPPIAVLHAPRSPPPGRTRTACPDPDADPSQRQYRCSA
jgi:hypothetical protein